MTSNQKPSNPGSGREVRAFDREVMARWVPNDQSNSPIFMQLAWFLINLIIEGRLELGELMPSETTLAKQFGMSRMTARHAVEALKDIGVVSRNRRGTRIDVSPDEAASLSGQFWTLLDDDQITNADSVPLRVNRRLDTSPNRSLPNHDRRFRSSKEELLSRSRRLDRSTVISYAEIAAPQQDLASAEVPADSQITSAQASRRRSVSDSQHFNLRASADIDALAPPVDASLAAVGVGRFGHEVVAHLVADLIEEGESFFSGRPIPGLRVIGVDSDNEPFLQIRSPIQRAFRSLGRIASRMHLGPDVNLVSATSKSLTLNEEFKGLELCFLVSGLNEAQNREYLPNLLKALEAQGTKTIALLSLPEAWEAEQSVSAADECLQQILDTKASVIAIPLSSIGIPEEDLAWEDHLQEAVRYFSSGFETLLRASSWTEGASNLTLSDLYSVLKPGHRGALGFSEVSGIDRPDRVSQLLNEGIGRLRRQGVSLSEISQIIVVLSGSRSFTRSEVGLLIPEIQNMCGPEARVLFGTSRIPVQPDELHLTLIV